MNVVIVDDYKEHADTIAACVSNLGYDAYVYYKKDNVIQKILTADPHLFICDGLMEGKRAWRIGYELLKECPENKRPYMVALTGFGSTLQRRLCEECGFDEYATKPIEFCTLTTWIAKSKIRAEQLGHILF